MDALGLVLVLPFLAVASFVFFAAFRSQRRKALKIMAVGCLGLGLVFALVLVGFVTLFLIYNRQTFPP